MKKFKDLTLDDFEMVNDGYYECEGINKANYILKLEYMPSIGLRIKGGWHWLLLDSDRDAICMSDTYNRRPSLALSNCKRRLKGIMSDEQ